VTSDNDDHEFKSIKDKNICIWKETILVKSNSLCKVESFGHVVRTLEFVKLNGYV